MIVSWQGWQVGPDRFFGLGACTAAQSVGCSESVVQCSGVTGAGGCCFEGVEGGREAAWWIRGVRPVAGVLPKRAKKGRLNVR